MSDPIAFDNQTARFALPLLFSGQAQKEFYVNEAHAILDSLLYIAIDGSGTTPPASPVNGACWLIASAATGAWAGLNGHLACYQAGNWVYITPRDGLSILNRTSGQVLRYWAGWQSAGSVSAPSGGTVIDTEARNTIGQIILALKTAGVLASG